MPCVSDNAGVLPADIEPLGDLTERRQWLRSTGNRTGPANRARLSYFVSNEKRKHAVHMTKRRKANVNLHHADY